MSESLSLVLAPDCRFEKLAVLLREQGWVELPPVSTAPPLLAGEPELAQWQRGDSLLAYTFNPVVSLRVVNASGVEAEALLTTLGEQLPTETPKQLATALGDSDQRTVLRAVLAAEQLGITPFVAALGLLAASPDPEVARNAARVHLSLAKRQVFELLDGEDWEALGEALKVVAGNAMPTLAAMVDAGPNEILGLQPTAEDCAAAFVDDMAPRVCEAYEQLWREPPLIDAGSDRTDIVAHACPAELFASDNPFSFQFPGGYRPIAPYLRPRTIWLAWDYCEPGMDSGYGLDGMVHVNGDWVWFPKPYRVVEGILRQHKYSEPY